MDNVSEYLNLEDVAIQRGETPFTLARLLTKKECKLYLNFGGGKERLLCITEKMIKGYYHLFQGKKGVYPMTLTSQHECVQRLSNNNFDLSGLSFMVGEDEIRLKSVDDEDRSVCVAVLTEDVEKFPPPSQLKDTFVTSTITTPKRKILKNSPISIFIDEQISNGRYEWQKAWKELRENIADDKNTKTEDMKLHTFGEKAAFIRRTMKHTSNKFDYAIEYQEDGVPTIKTVAKQDFGRMFRDALKKSRSRSETPQ